MIAMRFALAVLVGCTGGGGTFLEADRWSEADALFRADPHWLGGDAAASIPLDGDRSLWLFGDSFVATSGDYARDTAAIVHSTVGLQTGRDPETARLDLAWGSTPTPVDYFAARDTAWLAPLGGARLPDGALLIFLAAVTGPAPGGGVFAAGTRAVRIADPTGHPRTWVREPLALAPPAFAPDAELGGCSTVDGRHLVALSVDGGRGRLVRWSLAALAAGRLDERSWWTGDGWVAEAALVEPPAVVVSDASSRCTLLFDPQLGYEPAGRWIYVASDPRGVVRYREAVHLEGPYLADERPWLSSPTVAPDERAGGARLHPQLAAGGGYLLTFTVSSSDPAALYERADTLWWPRAGRVWHVEVVE